MNDEKEILFIFIFKHEEKKKNGKKITKKFNFIILLVYWIKKERKEIKKYVGLLFFFLYLNKIYYIYINIKLKKNIW